MKLQTQKQQKNLKKKTHKRKTQSLAKRNYVTQKIFQGRVIWNFEI